MDESKVLNNDIKTDISNAVRNKQVKNLNKMGKERRSLGIDIVNNAPWGTHLCLFFQNKEDLIDILAPYFKAGLENNEFCMWVCWEPLGAEEAKASLNKILPNVGTYIKRGQIEIVDYSRQQSEREESGFSKMKQFWIDKERQALERGFEGLRLAGNTYWLERNEWKDFVKYEEEVDNIIKGHKMLAICPYSLDKCGASEIIDVIGNHKSAIIRREGEWEIIESAERKKAKEEIKKAEEGFRMLIENSSDIMAILKGDMSIQYVSPTVEKLLGYRQEYFIGKKVLNYIHPEDLPVAQTKLTEIIKRPGIAIPIEFRIRHRNDSWICVEVVANNLLENPNVEAIILNARDITMHKQAEKMLKASEEKYRTIFETTGTATIIVDEDTTISMVNREFEKIFGYSKTEVEGKKSWTELINKEYLERVKGYHHLRRVNPDSVPHNYTCRFSTKQGVLKTAFLTVDMIPGTKKSVASVLDITEHKAAEEKIQHQSEFLKNMLECLTHPFYVIDANDYTIKMANSAANLDSLTEASTCYALTHKRDKPCAGEHICTLEEVKKTKKPVTVEHVHYNKDNKPRYFEVHGFPVFNSEGNVIQMIEYSLDITERKSAEEAILNLSRFPSENPNPVLRIDGKGSILYKNPSIDALLKKMKLSEKDISKILPDNLKTVIKKALKTKKAVYDLEIPVTNKNFSYSIIPVVKSGYVNLYAVDVTERKKAEAEIRENERRFRNLSESLPQLVWTCLPDGRCDFLSRQWIEYTGIPEAGQLGFGWLKQLHPSDRKSTVRAWNKTVKRDANFDVEFRIRRRDGVYRWFKTRAVAIRDANGKVIKWFGSNTDIDDLKKTERKIRREKKKAEKLFVELDIAHKKLKKIQKQLLGRERIIATGALAAGVAHEIRNPLAIIGMTVQYLQSKLKENDPKRELTEAIIKKVERLDRVTKELSSYGRTMDLNIRKHKLARCLNMNLALIKPKCRVQRIKIKKRYSRLPLVEIDDEQMDKVFLNIMDNAIQAMPKGGTLTASTEFDEKANMAIIKIHNTGPAIKKKDLPHIFKPFYTSRKGKGTGLGLAIVHNVIVRHNGQIAVLNRLSGKDKGVCFVISLPVTPPPPPRNRTQIDRKEVIYEENTKRQQQ